MKQNIFVVFSIGLFIYLLGVGGHFVAAHWWQVLALDMPPYFQWWDSRLNTTPRLLLWFFLPSLAYTILQLNYLKGTLIRD